MRKIFVLHEEKKYYIGKQFLFKENKIQNKTTHKYENNCKSPFYRKSTLEATKLARETGCKILAPLMVQHVLLAL